METESKVGDTGFSRYRDRISMEDLYLKKIIIQVIINKRWQRDFSPSTHGVGGFFVVKRRCYDAILKEESSKNEN